MGQPPWPSLRTRPQGHRRCPVASKKTRTPAVPDYRGYLRNRLETLESRFIERDGYVDGIYVRAYGLDRLARIGSPDPLRVQGFEIEGAVPPKQKGAIEALSFYDI